MTGFVVSLHFESNNGGAGKAEWVLRPASEDVIAPLENSGVGIDDGIVDFAMYGLNQSHCLVAGSSVDDDASYFVEIIGTFGKVLESRASAASLSLSYGLRWTVYVVVGKLANGDASYFVDIAGTFGDVVNPPNSAASRSISPPSSTGMLST